jgi:hypothetical protein
MNIMGKNNAAVKIYQLNYMVGFSIAFIVFCGSNLIWPPPGTDISEPFDEAMAIDGVASSDTASGTETPSKVEMTTNEKDVSGTVV